MGYPGTYDYARPHVGFSDTVFVEELAHVKPFPAADELHPVGVLAHCRRPPPLLCESVRQSRITPVMSLLLSIPGTLLMSVLFPTDVAAA
eukprot:scaffold491824_cov19-Prasinocladus_malaysianus.AAC.1